MASVITFVGTGMDGLAVEIREVVFVAGFVLYVTIRHRFERAVRKQAVAARTDDPVERALLALVLLTALVLPILHLCTPLFAFADHPSLRGASVVGGVLMAAALWLFFKAHTDLGRNWSMQVEVYEGHEIVHHGIYARIRHPMYTAILLFDVAQGILLANYVAGWGALIGFGLLCMRRIPREEQLMIDRFGDDYRAYRSSTGCLFPRAR